LLTVSQTVQIFVAKDGFSKLFDMLGGERIVGVWLPDNCLKIIVEMIRIVVTSLEEKKKDIMEHIDILEKLFKSKKPGYKMSAELGVEIINLYLPKLQEKDQESIKIIGDKILPHILKLFKQGVFDDKASAEKILVFFLGFVPTPEHMAKIRDAGVESDIKKFEEYESHKPKVVTLTKELKAKPAEKKPPI
jgi:hypothetical protein